METGLGKSRLAPPISFEKGGQKVLQVGQLLFPTRKAWIKTFGCQMNHHDTERILCHLKNLNFSQTDHPEQANLILLNSCAVRNLSNNKFYSLIGEMKHIKKKRKDLIIGIGGCVAQTEGKALLKRYPHLDFAFGTDVIDEINDMVYRAYAGERKFFFNSWDRSEHFSIETKISHNSPQAFVNIIKGCNKYCSYCIVPYTRGKERSRKIEEIVRDIEKLVHYRGIQEIILLGQNVNSFGKDNGESLAKLLYKLEDIQGLRLIRYTTSHPYDVTDELIEAHGNLKKLSRHLHLPVQSGSNTVLKRMRREYTVERYLGLLEKLRKSCPSIVFSTDIIVGFVNESEEEFKATLKLLDLAQYDSLFSYAYSMRPKTRAANMQDDLTDEIRGRRLRYLQKYQLDIQKKIRQSLIGKTFLVLVDGYGKELKDQEKRWRGRTNCNRIVHFSSPKGSQEDYKWKWISLKITEASALCLKGELV